MKNIHIENSYKVWSETMMSALIIIKCYEQYDDIFADEILNRSWASMHIEWYLHNIGYWLTLPFVRNEKIKRLNNRFKHVDLEEHQ